LTLFTESGLAINDKSQSLADIGSEFLALQD